MATDYPDYGALQALQAFITSLDLASATLQASATQISDAIAATGVPLLAGPVALYGSAASSFIPAAGTITQENSAAGTITDMSSYLSYDIWIKDFMGSAATLPFLVATMHWYADAGGTQEVYRETWVSPVETSGTGINTIGSGPVRGAYLSVTLTNADPSVQLQIIRFYLTGNARPSPMLQPDWRNYPLNLTYNTSLTAMQGGGNVDGILGTWTTYFLGAGLSTTYVFGVYNGQVNVSLVIAGTAPNVTMTALAYVPGEGLMQIGAPVTYSAAGSYFFTAYPPRGPLMIKAVNNNVSDGVDISWTAVAVTQF